MTAATSTRQDRAALFANLAAAETQPQFWARVSDEVDWSVMGTHPLAGRYAGKQKFIDATFARLAGVLQGGAKLEVQNLLVDGDTVVAELASTSISNEGAPFDNKYCWVCRFDGDIIVEVRAYLDSAMVTYTVLRNEALKGDADVTAKPAA
jgi:ketosteroid isomerase-like protein